MPSVSDIAEADDIELQEIMEIASKSMEDLISQMKNDQSQTDDLFEYPLCKLLGLDKQLRSIKGSLKVEMAKKVQLEKNIKKSIASSRNSESILEFTVMINSKR